MRVNLGSLMQSVDRHELAMELYEEALHMQKACQGPMAVDVGHIQNNMAALYNILTQHGEAELCYRNALRIYKQMGSTYPGTALVHNNLAMTLKRLNKDREALMHYERALMLRRKIYGDQHPEIALVVSNLSALQLKMGNVEEALRLSREALELLTYFHGPDHAMVASTQVTLGGALLQAGELHNAKAMFEKANAVQLELFSPSHPDVKTSQRWISLCNLQTKQLSEYKKMHKLEVASIDNMAKGVSDFAKEKVMKQLDAQAGVMMELAYQSANVTADIGSAATGLTKMAGANGGKFLIRGIHKLKDRNVPSGHGKQGKLGTGGKSLSRTRTLELQRPETMQRAFSSKRIEQQEVQKKTVANKLAMIRMQSLGARQGMQLPSDVLD
jgi:tetratricopeptide (TPR) repeat protein